MKLKILNETVYNIEDNLSKIENVDVTIKVYHTDNLEKVEEQKDNVKFTITDKLEIKTLDNKMVLSQAIVGEYIIHVTNDMTLEQLNHVYKRPYVVLKSHFDSYKKKKPTIENCNFPEYVDLTTTVMSAFQDRIYDLLSS